MQTTRKERTTQRAVRIMSALAIATWLGAGCGKTEKTELPPPESPNKAVEAEKWEPETVELPKEPIKHDHTHGPGGHTH